MCIQRVYSCVCLRKYNLVAAVSSGSRPAVEKMYISLIRSSDLPGGSPSSGLLLNPKITLHSYLLCQCEQWGRERLYGAVGAAGSFLGIRLLVCIDEYVSVCVCVRARVCVFSLCAKGVKAKRHSLGEKSISWRRQQSEPIGVMGEKVRSGSGRRGTKEGIMDCFMLPGKLLCNVLKQLFS